jgi:hypothetical protein
MKLSEALSAKARNDKILIIDRNFSNFCYARYWLKDHWGPRTRVSACNEGHLLEEGKMYVFARHPVNGKPFFETLED